MPSLSSVLKIKRPLLQIPSRGEWVQCRLRTNRLHSSLRSCWRIGGSGKSSLPEGGGFNFAGYAVKAKKKGVKVVIPERPFTGVSLKPCFQNQTSSPLVGKEKGFTLSPGFFFNF